MRQVSPYRLWLGNVQDARDLRAVLDRRIEAIVDLAANETPPAITRDLVYMRFPVLDSTGNSPWLLHLAIDAVRQLIQANVPALVYFSAGMSRTPAIVGAALALVTARPFADCLQELIANAPHDVSAGLITDVQAVLR